MCKAALLEWLIKIKDSKTFLKADKLIRVMF